MSGRPLLIFSVLLVLVAGSASAAWTENVGFNDEVSAEVDRPFINHVKAFLNNHFEPGYQFLFEVEESSGNETG